MAGNDYASLGKLKLRFSDMRVWILFLLPSTVWAHLFFKVEMTRPMDPATWQLDIGATHGRYQIAFRDEARTYLPDLSFHLQLYKRVAVSVAGFGVLRSEFMRDDIDYPLGEEGYGGGDEIIGLWFDIYADYKDINQSRAAKLFIKAKLPSANGAFGSDRTDLLFGITGHAQRNGHLFQGTFRLDVVERPVTEGQWDYLTLGLRYSHRIGPAKLISEGFFRSQSSRYTWLLSFGLQAELGKNWSLELMAGDGGWQKWENNPDSRLEYQFSLFISKRGESDRLFRWLGN